MWYAIDMPSTLTRALQRLAEPRHGSLVFGGRDGQPLDPDNLSHRRFPRALRQAGIARVGLSVHADNERAIAFYRKAGWNETYRSDAGLWFEKSI